MNASIRATLTEASGIALKDFRHRQMPFKLQSLVTNVRLMRDFSGNMRYVEVLNMRGKYQISHLCAYFTSHIYEYCGAFDFRKELTSKQALIPCKSLHILEK